MTEQLSSRPNVVFILTDDQGPWAAGCYGNPEIRTPNIDRLAATGMLFERFYVATPVCSPSRGTFLTGRIPSQHGIHEWVKDENVGPHAKALTAGEVAYTDLLAEHGYFCGLSGKWHLGDSQRPQHGFRFWYAHQLGGGPYNNAPMVRNGQLIDEPGYVTDNITTEALSFLDAHAGDENPFYLSVHYTAPHAPWTGHPQEIVDSYDDCPFDSCPQETRHPWAIQLTERHLGNRESLKGYFAAVTAMDSGVGRIVDRVEELNLRDRTLIVFASDNGFNCGHHGFWGKGNGTHPRNMYENSVRVPFIASHPGVIPSGVRTQAMVSAYDFMPTLLDYVGLPCPTAECNLPGSSFAAHLRGQDWAGNDAIYIFDEYGPVRMVRTEEWKYVHRYPDGPHELFHVAVDPDERHNLAGDASHASTVSDLRKMLESWFQRFVIPERDGLKETY